VLLLFDIDGTLLGSAAQAHSHALHAALAAVHRVDTASLTRPFSPAGRTDAEIARGLLLTAGVSARRIAERADDVREECCRIYAELCPPSLADKVLPGVADLLDWLSGVDRVRLSLVTGNFEPVARLKLSRAGLGHHFPVGQGGFGSDSEDRTDLPPIARRRAGAGGVSYPRERTIVIGDTPRDIACARADGLRCFAVATGPFGVSDLGDADAVTADASGVRRLVQDAL
jgi:phosphoglycolate phosphatase-like HAD superfamily hydrolase